MKKQKNTHIKNQNLLVAGAVAAAVGGGVFWYTYNTEPYVPPIDILPVSSNSVEPAIPVNAPSNTTVPAGDVAQLKGKNILNIGPQSPGSSLIVDLVNLVKPGFIAVYQANGKGQAGTLITTSPLLRAGTSEDLVVKATLKPNTTYVISLRNDDGDGKFNAAKDLILLDVKGSEVVQNITTSAK